MTDDELTRAGEAGEVRGRLIALEGRMDRHENKMDAALAAINIKLDLIQAAISRNVGSSGVVRFLVNLGGMISAGIVGALVAFGLRH